MDVPDIERSRKQPGSLSPNVLIEPYLSFSLTPGAAHSLFWKKRMGGASSHACKAWPPGGTRVYLVQLLKVPGPLLLTIAALRFPGISCLPIAPLPRNPLAYSASGSASPQKHRPASRFPAPKRGRKPGPFLETSSLFPPPAALRLLYTVAALVIPASDKAEITAAASKVGRFFCLRQRFPAFHITRWKTLCIMWKTSYYVILWKSCENFAHPLCTAKVL